MKTFAYIDTGAKRVQGWFTADDNFLASEAPTQAGAVCVEWVADVSVQAVNRTHWVDLVDLNGRQELLLNEYTPKQLQRKATQPQYPAEWSNTAMSWIDMRSIEQAKIDGQAQIDDAAGQARLRYITDVPGQQATYQRKEVQAREWTEAGYPDPAPSFIAAEAEALGTTPQAIAQQVIALADYWAYVKGPEIEASRIKHKAAVRSAVTLEAVQAALDAALADLEAL